jgi:hypothetical protein
MDIHLDTLLNLPDVTVFTVREAIAYLIPPRSFYLMSMGNDAS